MLASNPLDISSWTSHNVPHVGEFLCEHFEARWPETARIYAGCVSQATDVTPADEDGIEALEKHDLLFVVVYPADPVTTAVVLGIVAIAAVIAAVLLIPSPPKTSKEKQTLQGSPNNSLTDRDNVARPEQRIPDIFGLVKSRPDLVMVPYIQYENHRQCEIGLYCIGDGFFDVTADNVRDGSTRIDQIDQAACHIYDPGTAPTGVGPFSGTNLAIGAPIADPVLNVYQVKAVNGQAMEPFNSRTLFGAAKKPDADGSYNTTTVYNFFNILAIEYLTATTGKLHIPYLQETSYVHDRVSPGDLLWFRFDPADLHTSGAPKPNLQTTDGVLFTDALIVTSLTDAGDYVEVGVTVPAALAAEWAKIPAYSATVLARFGTSFDNPFAEVTSLTELYEGPFFVDFVHPVGSSNAALLVNFVAPQGLYVDDGKSIHKSEISFIVGVTPCDSAGIATSAEVLYNPSLIGSDRKDGTRAISFYQLLGFNGRFLLRARRATNRLRREELPDFVEAVNYPAAGGNKAFTGTIQDEIRWTEAYSMSEPPNISFGDVTLVHTKTVNTDAATKEKERSLNILCTRKIQTWNGTTFGGTPVANADAENVLFSVMTDPFIGNRPTSQIDFAGIAACMDTVRHYFNDSNTGALATLVSITLDDNSMSFEETVIAIATMAFSLIYRQGNVLKCKPDIATDSATLAFNHRNIVSGTQKITHTLGPPTENDSVEVDYTDPIDGTQTHVHVPLFGSTVSPASLKIVGLGTRQQALWHAYRGYQKMQFQRQALEMQTTQEGCTVIVKDRVLIADTTALSRQSGNIVQVSGLSLKLSQPPTFVGGKTYTIFLQHPDGTTEGIPLTVGSGFFDAVLGSAPAVAIITDPTVGVPTLYNIVQDDDAMPAAYLVSEMTADTNMEINISAINYSNMYYMGDSLDTWLHDSLTDYSPAERPLTADHFVPQLSVAPRGIMLDLDGANVIEYDTLATPPNPGILDLVFGYTFFAWVKHTSQPATFAGIIETQLSNEVNFSYSNNILTGSHFGVLYTSDSSIAPGNLESVALTYDPVAHRMAMFRNGKLVSASTGVAALTTPVAFVYGRALLGQMGDVMRWKRCWPDRAVTELHQKTLI